MMVSVAPSILSIGRVQKCHLPSILNHLTRLEEDSAPEQAVADWVVEGGHEASIVIRGP